MASGGDFMVRKPTLFLAGEAGPERATFTPFGSSPASVQSGARSVSIGQIIIQPQVASDDDPDKVARVVSEAIRSKAILHDTLTTLMDRRIEQAA
jgi:hypothetical protein